MVYKETMNDSDSEIHSPAVGMIPSPTDVGALANRINFCTRDMHTKADAFVMGKMALAMRHGFIYRQGILAFYYIFHAVEQQIDRLLETPSTKEELQISAILRQFWCEEFRRSGRLLRDLEFFYHHEYPTQNELQQFLNDFELPPKLQRFVDFIRDKTMENPSTILAYCHVLYNALFAGGKVMRSNIYRNIGLFPKPKGISAAESSRNGTNFFTFSDDGVDEENKLRWQYKKNYELATREGLDENQKLEIIDVSIANFQAVMDILGEIGETNKKELMNIFSFKLLTFLSNEWRYNQKLSSEVKQALAIAVFFINFLMIYFTLRTIFW
ncbi:Hmx1p Ecym_4729 [Eremothecium cymbalariae DBVPG|uniref:Heme oxygenase n=1 Tax=Eremothecium cymbalariae (strain CBS 270.75 / DBVPG 7215 / KCTC 17166 / NRRL Y-17582) TaxID=931890 RepID=G8JSM6_ERECY|nr:hypothetical protein Ecym_4729 [Eremothecium cymbalariae DBVPG\